jgi:hypothetical protein
MAAIVQYRLTEDGSTIRRELREGERIIPPIGTVIDLEPVSHGLGKVISIDAEMNTIPPGTDEIRLITLNLERIG